METLEKLTPQQCCLTVRQHPPAPSADMINLAYHQAKSAMQESVFKAIVCGQMMRERRDMMNLSHEAKGLAKSDKTRAESDQFGVWREQKCPDISKDTAYRWMKIAEQVCGFLELGPSGDLLLSLLLQRESNEAQILLEYISGKTMQECLQGVIVEGDPEHRLTRAQNGMAKGGAGGDRKDWPGFIETKLRHINEHLSHWDNFSGPQIERTQTVFKVVITGWPAPLLEYLKNEAAKVLRDRPKGAQ